MTSTDPATDPAEPESRPGRARERGKGDAGSWPAFGFRPLAEGRGFPEDASDGLRGEFAGYGGPRDVHGTTWLTWAELDTTDWQATDASGIRIRASAAGIDTDWGRVWSVMRILSDGAENVRIVVWFH
ncbi:hypothetical protein MTF65_02780 [Streptomyces sp. APSN-46.1]|uniref:hypothetical protein n=1 Tax=Streptomyces sp. APSN-46.1 TaxID=2929049 RepID=UPI001FB2AE8A|nr:hypothetical protein [Streptomyces sp. APSN-46.1]MCJ1676296.1 hypothetical protein [Streptomyces sp. APSN-46.1]